MLSLGLLLVSLAGIACGQNKWEFYSYSSQPGAVAYGRLDPIISPGAVSEHVHMFHGSGALQSTYDYDTIMRESTCSSVQVQQDFSNYWAPAMYSYSNGQYQLMLAVFQIYYKFNTLSYDPNNAAGSTKRYAFPPGLTMIAGNRASRQVNGSDWSTFASVFQCQRSNGNSPYSHDFRDFQKQGQQCDDSLRVTVDFPSCWDGVADNSDRTHMVYPNSNLGAGGVCPESHPMATMQLTYEWYYPVQNFPFDPSRTDNWVLSFGDTSGFGMHSDFTNGWNVTLLQEAVDQCGDLFSNEIENCPPFAPWNGYQVPPCMASGLYPNEEVGLTGVTAANGLKGVTLSALPGCNPLWTDNSTKPTCSSPVATPPIDLRYGPDLSSWNYLGCPMSATPAGLILWDVQNTGWTNLTVDMCLESCAGYKYAMTTWGANCYCDNEIKNNGTIESSMDYTCFVHCPGDWSQICGGFGSANLYEACTGNDCFQNREIGPVATAALGAGLATSTAPNYAASASAAHSKIECNWSDGRNYTLGGKVFQIECWQNHWYGDLTSLVTSSMEQCLTYCAGYTGCVAGVYTPSDGVCWIKGASMQSGQTDTGEISGVLIDAAPAPSAVISSVLSSVTAILPTILPTTIVSTNGASSSKVSSTSAPPISSSTTTPSTSTLPSTSTTPAASTTPATSTIPSTSTDPSTSVLPTSSTSTKTRRTRTRKSSTTTVGVAADAAVTDGDPVSFDSSPVPTLEKRSTTLITTSIAAATSSTSTTCTVSTVTTIAYETTHIASSRPHHFHQHQHRRRDF